MATACRVKVSAAGRVSQVQRAWLFTPWHCLNIFSLSCAYFLSSVGSSGGAHLAPLSEVIPDHGLRDSCGDAPHVNAGAAPPSCCVWGFASRCPHAPNSPCQTCRSQPVFSTTAAKDIASAWQCRSIICIFLAGKSLCKSRKTTECEVWGGHQSRNLFVARLQVDTARPHCWLVRWCFGCTLIPYLVAEAWTAGRDTRTGEGDGKWGIHAWRLFIWRMTCLQVAVATPSAAPRGRVAGKAGEDRGADRQHWRAPSCRQWCARSLPLAVRRATNRRTRVSNTAVTQALVRCPQTPTRGCCKTRTDKACRNQTDVGKSTQAEEIKRLS